MTRDLMLALASLLGASALGVAITLLVIYWRAGPEFPPLPPVQRDP